MELHGDECPCTLNEAELFDPIAKQVVLMSSKEQDYSPITAVSNNTGVIEFKVEGTNDEYIDLNETELVLDVKVLKADNSNLAATDVIAPINNWLHSMFSDIKMEIQNTVVEGGEHMYPYKAYMHNLLSHDYYSKRTQLATSGWFKDTTGKMNTNTDNTGFTSRQALIARSRSIQLSGPILLDMMLQNKFLLPKTSFKLSLTRNKAEFQICVFTATTVANRAQKVIIQIESAKLKIRRVKALPSHIQQSEDNLLNQNALYPIQHTVMNTFTIASGLTSYHCQDMFSGQLPKLIFIALVRNDAYNGAYNQNPFNFENFNVNSVKLVDSSDTATFQELTPNYADKKVASVYNSLFKALGIYNKSESFDMTVDEYIDGYTIYAFNLTPDMHASGHQQISRNATIRLDLGFSAATASAISVIAMGVFDGRIQITKDRQVFCDWKS